jgi:hypothetical protein
MDVTLYGTGSARLRPPATLGEPERRAFLDLVTTTPAEQFQPSDMPLLIRWAELTVMCEQARGELAVQGMVVTDDKGKASVSPVVHHPPAGRQSAQRACPAASSRSAVESIEGTEENRWAGVLFRTDGVGGHTR